MLHEFKKFILRGNVLDLAVGVILGAAFNTVVAAFSNDVLMAAVAAVFGEPNFDNVVIPLGGDGELRVGVLFTALVNLVLVGLALFLVVKVANVLRDRDEEEQAIHPETKPAPSDEALLLAEIRDLLRERAAS